MHRPVGWPGGHSGGFAAVPLPAGVYPGGPAGTGRLFPDVPEPGAAGRESAGGYAC